MNLLSSLTGRLMLTILVAVAPPCAIMYFCDLPWMGVVMAVLAVGAGWYCADYFNVALARDILAAVRRLTAGDLGSRTREQNTGDELGELASAVNEMAVSVEQRAKASQTAERMLMNRAQQQTVVAALEQFALFSQDLSALANQAVSMVAQTLEVELTQVLTAQSDGRSLFFQAGVGWKSGYVGTATLEVQEKTQIGFALTSGEPVVVEDTARERRFIVPDLLIEHGVVSGVAVAIATRQTPIGVLTAYARSQRTFTGDEVNFLVAVATTLGLAAERCQTDMVLQKLAAFAQLNPNPALELAPDGKVTYANEAASQLARSVKHEQPQDVLPPDTAEIVQNCLESGQSRVHCETKIEGRTVSWSFHPMSASRVVHCYGEDITERLNLEAQLLQSQKMESVGQLAAGVAHDFNNMLTIIQGHAGLLMTKARGTPGLTDSAQAIHFASERAAALTRQLLVFSRKNVVQLRMLDLREVVGNMNKMLRRLLGETVELIFQAPPQLPLVHGDRGMMEQILMNFVVNARDAMPKGGKLTIGLEPVVLNEAAAALNPNARPGAFVCLRVGDTGAGIDPEIVSRIFEPFFTTKEVGKGTGLGLATVYGIVKQHSGWIEVKSELGQGTTFSVFLPARMEVGREAKHELELTAHPVGGKETLLIVEDEPVILDMALLILREGGYRVLTAGTGLEAQEVWEREHGAIDLLLTDMVMPGGVSGVDLAEKLLSRQPKLKVLFASGYTVDEVSEQFLQKNNARFLQKPYTSASLARGVRECLDRTPIAGVC